jgi:hypothetical protein
MVPIIGAGVNRDVGVETSACPETFRLLDIDKP